MSLPPLLKESEPTMQGWMRNVRDLLNLTVRRTSGSGPTAERPKNPPTGSTYYDTTLNRPIWYTTANTWINAAGTVV